MPPKRKADPPAAAVAPAAAPPPQALPNVDPKVQQLMQMGFGIVEATTHLNNVAGNQQKAIDSLLRSKAASASIPSVLYVPPAPPSPQPEPKKAKEKEPKNPKKQKPPQKSYHGKSICFTGALTMVRREAEALASARGMRVAKNVSSKTDIVVAGPGAGSKLGTAQMHGTEIWDEDQFRKFLGDASEDEASDGDDSDESPKKKGGRGGGGGGGKWAGAQFVTVKGVRLDEWTTEGDSDCMGEYPVPASSVKQTLAHDKSEAADIAREIANGLSGVEHMSETDSDWYAFVIRGFKNPDGKIDDYKGIISSALKIDSECELHHCKFTAKKQDFFSYRVDAEEGDDKSDDEDDNGKSEQKQRAQMTKLMRKKLRNNFGFTWNDEQVCYITIRGGFVPDGSAIAGVFAIQVTT